MNVIKLIEFANTYSGTVTAIVTLLSIIGGGLWTFLKFREYLKDKRFITYHKLIGELVDENSNPSGKLKLDRQIAIVYELRNFSSYYPVSKRILTDLKKDWVKNERIIKEIDLTLEFISRNFFIRFLKRLRKI